MKNSDTVHEEIQVLVKISGKGAWDGQSETQFFESESKNKGGSHPEDDFKRKEKTNAKMNIVVSNCIFKKKKTTEINSGKRHFKNLRLIKS